MHPHHQKWNYPVDPKVEGRLSADAAEAAADSGGMCPSA